MSKKIAAVIGCGAIAREHLAVLNSFDTVRVAAVCDLSPVRAEATAERFNVPSWFTNHQQLLSEIGPDLVHITTPPASHFAIAKDCLNGGFNVLCEKPLTTKYSDFQHLNDLAVKNGLMLMENQQNRFHSSILRINKLIESGDLGEVLEAHISISLNISADTSPYLDKNLPHFALKLPGGVIGDFLPHMAGLARMLVGPIHDLRTVWAKRNQQTPIPADEFRGLLRGERATAYVSFNGTAHVDGFWVRVVGERMRVETNLYEPPRFTVRRSRRGEPALMTLIDGLAESRDVLWGSSAGFVRKLAGKSSYDGLEDLLKGAYSALEGGGAQPIPLAEIAEVALLVERMTQSEFNL